MSSQTDQIGVQVAASAALKAMGIPGGAGGGPLLGARDMSASAKLSLAGDSGPATSGGGGAISGGAHVFDFGNWTSGKSQATNRTDKTPAPIYAPPQQVPLMSAGDAQAMAYGPLDQVYGQPDPITVGLGLGGLNPMMLIGLAALVMLMKRGH